MTDFTFTASTLDTFVGAGDADDRITYETDTGVLRFDSNGTAAGGVFVAFAVLSGLPAVSNADFVIG